MGIIAVGASMGLLKRIGILSKTPTLTLAARAYYENVAELSGRFEFYFEGIPLPGLAARNPAASSGLAAHIRSAASDLYSPTGRG